MKTLQIHDKIYLVGLIAFNIFDRGPTLAHVYKGKSIVSKFVFTTFFKQLIKSREINPSSVGDQHTYYAYADVNFTNFGKLSQWVELVGALLCAIFRYVVRTCQFRRPAIELVLAKAYAVMVINAEYLCDLLRSAFDGRNQ